MKDDSDRTAIQSVYVQRGLILYSYAIPQNKTEDTKVYANMHGKVPGDPSFKCWSFEPSGNWNYAVDMTSEVKLEYMDGKVRIQDHFSYQHYLTGNADLSYT